MCVRGDTSTLIACFCFQRRPRQVHVRDALADPSRRGHYEARPRDRLKAFGIYCFICERTFEGTSALSAYRRIRSHENAGAEHQRRLLIKTLATAHMTKQELEHYACKGFKIERDGCKSKLKLAQNFNDLLVYWPFHKDEHGAQFFPEYEGGADGAMVARLFVKSKFCEQTVAHTDAECPRCRKVVSESHWAETVRKFVQKLDVFEWFDRRSRDDVVGAEQWYASVIQGEPSNHASIMVGRVNL